MERRSIVGLRANVAVVFSTQRPTIAITDFSYNLVRPTTDMTERRPARCDGRTHDARGSETPTVAGVAGDAPHVKFRNLARVLQAAHGAEVDAARGRRT